MDDRLEKQIEYHTGKFRRNWNYRSIPQVRRILWDELHILRELTTLRNLHPIFTDVYLDT